MLLINSRSLAQVLLIKARPELIVQKREGCTTQMRVPGVLPQLQHLLEFHSVFNFPFIIYLCMEP